MPDSASTTKPVEAPGVAVPPFERFQGLDRQMGLALRRSSIEAPEGIHQNRAVGTELRDCAGARP